MGCDTITLKDIRLSNIQQTTNPLIFLGLISVGDEVVAVNNINVEGKTPNDVLKILKVKQIHILLLGCCTRFLYTLIQMAKKRYHPLPSSSTG